MSRGPKTPWFVRVLLLVPFLYGLWILLSLAFESTRGAWFVGSSFVVTATFAAIGSMRRPSWQSRVQSLDLWLMFGAAYTLVAFTAFASWPIDAEVEPGPREAGFRRWFEGTRGTFLRIAGVGAAVLTFARAWRGARWVADVDAQRRDSKS